MWGSMSVTEIIIFIFLVLQLCVAFDLAIVAFILSLVSMKRTKRQAREIEELKHKHE